MRRDGRAAALLVADIGGTNARFAVADGQGLSRQVVLPTKQFSTAQALLREALLALDAPSPQAACLAVAGPVSDGAVTVTNGGGLQLAEASLAPLLGCPVRIVNDFYALAVGVPLARRLERFGGGSGDDGVKAVIGPGSGLGMAALVPRGDAWLPLASEGGHGDLAPGSPLEGELLSVLQRRHSHVSWETVLCGPGMVRLHEAVAELWGAPAEALQAHEISTRGASLEDPVCHQTLEVFFALLGAAAGNLALTFCATGGVYIGGGIVPQLVEFARSSPMRRRFDERGELGEFAAAIPLFVLLDPSPGLQGALQCLPPPS